MAYFIPSSIQKRLLRYALSRLELLDTDALDLERLEIGWGRKSSVELRDVGLRKDKITSLLQLPSYVVIDTASIELLRITVPADIHASSVVVDILGLRTEARVLETESDGLPARKTGPSRSKLGRSSRKDHKTRSDDEPTLPTPHDLAKSFLEQEPQREKAELEANIASRSVDLQKSVPSSEISEEDSSYGTGLSIALPAFLADFLKGISDRLKVAISGVTLDIATTVLTPPASKEGLTTPPSSVPISVRFEAHRLNVKKVAVTSSVSESPSKSSDPTRSDRNQPDGTSLSSTGERQRIDVEELRCFLIADSRVFESFSLSSTKSEPFQGYQSPVHSLLADKGLEHSALRRSQNSDKRLSDQRDAAIAGEKAAGSAKAVLDDSMLLSIACNRETLPDHSVANHREMTLEQSQTSDLLGSFGDESMHGSDRRLPQSSIHSETPFSKHLHNALRSFREERRSSAQFQSRSPSPRAQSRNKPEHQTSTPPSLARIPGNFESDHIQENETPPRSLQSSLDNGGNHHQMFGERRSTPDPLAESRVFSHEDAESIYMSVLNEPDEHASAPESRNMPGGWMSEPEEALHRTQHHDRNRQKVSDQSDPNRDNKASLALNSKGLGVLQGSSASQPLPEEAPESTTEKSKADLRPFRELFALDKMDIILGDDPEVHCGSASQHNFKAKNNESLMGASNVEVPGAFSQYAESVLQDQKSSSVRSPQSPSSDSDNRPTTATFTNTALPHRYKTELLFGTLDTNLDLATLAILTRLSTKLLEILETSRTSSRKGPKESSQKRDDSVDIITMIDIRLKALRVKVMENTRSSTHLEADRSGSGLSLPAHTEEATEIINLNLDDANLHVKSLSQKMSGLFSAHKINAKIVGQQLLRFDRRHELKSSIGSIDPEAHDLSLSFSSSPEMLELTANTMPVRADLDLFQIDNSLDSLGGFSGLIELGSSILSESSSLHAKTSQTDTPRPRAVHFDASTKLAATSKQSFRKKLNLRIGGASVFLKSKTSGVQFQSSAVKVVFRDSLMGMQIDQIKILSQISSSHDEGSGMDITLHNTNLKYLFSPEEHDLTRLISLLTPSSDRFEEDDDFLVDTLIRQRRKGAVLRATISTVEVNIVDATSVLKLKDFMTEISKLSSVTKYLPEESRPGLLILGLVHDISISGRSLPRLNQFSIRFKETEMAHVTAPSLTAFGVRHVDMESRPRESILHPVLPSVEGEQSLMIMGRMIGEEVEPTLKIKLWNFCFEYSVPLVMSLMAISEVSGPEDFSIDVTTSVADLTSPKKKGQAAKGPESQPSKDFRLLKIDISLRDCAVGLIPRVLPSKALFVICSARVQADMSATEKLDVSVDIGKASMLLVDDTGRLIDARPFSGIGRPRSSSIEDQQISRLCKQGYVSVCWISAACLRIKMEQSLQNEPKSLDVEFRDELFLLETCADSTQTLIELLNALQPPRPPSKGQKYRTEITPVKDLMTSFTGEEFALKQEPRPEDAPVNAPDFDDLEDPEAGLDLDPFGDMPDMAATYEDEDDDDDNVVVDSPSAAPALEVLGFDEEIEGLPLAKVEAQAVDESEIITGGFKATSILPRVDGRASKWDSSNNRYVPVRNTELLKCPFKLRVRDIHIIWNLHDGYDWPKTQASISKAIEEVEAKAEARKSRHKVAPKDDEENDSVIGDFLFNSIYIGIPENRDPRELARQINQEVNEPGSETTSQVTTTTARNPCSPLRPGRRLRLERSKRHKIAFELSGVSADVFVFPPGEETLSSIDVRVKELEIFDHVPTSTWKKFATYLQDEGPREERKSMAHIEVCDVRPVPELTASELVIRLTALPLRLHIDQDALDFMTRFFDFHDDASTPVQPSDISTAASPHNIPSEASSPYLQRVEVRPIPVVLDYKPKSISYTALRSGRTTEFMNFFILDSAQMTLRHTIIYGCSSFAKLHGALEDVWMPDIRRNQLPSVLSGLNGIRTVVNVAEGFKGLIEVPIREYRRDGRVMRSISRGVGGFVRTTGGELSRFGAKLAVGAGNVLQGAEQFLVSGASSSQQQSGRRTSSTHRYSTGPLQQGDDEWDPVDILRNSPITAADDDEPRAPISAYATQPTNVLTGLRSAARSLERDLLVSRNALIAISGEAREEGTVGGAARAVARGAPTLVLRPMIGASRAVSAALWGVGNTVDRENLRRAKEKYKRY